MQNEYLITKKQVDDLEFYKEMFAEHADRIKELCNLEKEDISYGFELGQIYSNLRTYFSEMMILIHAIKESKAHEKSV